MTTIGGVDVRGPVQGRFSEILTSEALAFLASLQEAFNPTRLALLKARAQSQEELRRGRSPDFLPETESVREGTWRVAVIPGDLQDRRVEITGPVERKMMINALNSGAQAFMADFEDSLSPTWTNVVAGHLNLRDAVRRSIRFVSPDAKVYELQKDLLTYFVIVLVMFAIREFRIRRAGELRAQKLAADLSEARLRHLTAQIDPHFLFNALNAISNRMREDVDAADRMISQLGDLLRAAYESDDSVLVPLGRELGWLRGYAAMMAERFRGQLAFEIEVDPGIETLQVPRLLLQPIVENAIRHGLKDGHGWLKVAVRRNGNKLHYTVSDDGVGLPEKPLERGTGLSNISRRLELLFPDSHELAFGSREPHGAVVSLAFPVST